METSIWARIVEFFAREIHSTYKVQAVAGFVMGGSLGYAHYFGNIHIPAELMHSWLGMWLWVKSVFWAGSTSIATSLGSKVVDWWWEKRSKKKSSPNERKRKNKAA